MAENHDDKITAEVLPLTDEQLLDAQIASALDVVIDTKVQIQGLEHVLRTLWERLVPLERRLQAMQELRKTPDAT